MLKFIFGAFLILFLSGFWLNRSGKPYGTFIFTIHKLTGLGTGIQLFIMVRQAYQTMHLGPVEVAAVTATILCFIGIATTGSLLSVPISKPMPGIVSTLNKIFPYFTVMATAITLYLLLHRK